MRKCVWESLTHKVGRTEHKTDENNPFFTRKTSKQCWTGSMIWSSEFVKVENHRAWNSRSWFFFAKGQSSPKRKERATSWDSSTSWPCTSTDPFREDKKTSHSERGLVDCPRGYVHGAFSLLQCSDLLKKTVRTPCYGVWADKPWN